MSQHVPGVKMSIEAADSVSAHRVVALTGQRQGQAWLTSTAQILGLSEAVADSGGAIAVIVSGSGKATCNASISAGDLVTPATGAAGAIATAANTTTSKILGLALESGSTNSSIEVLLQIDNRNSA